MNQYIQYTWIVCTTKHTRSNVYENWIAEKERSIYQWGKERWVIFSVATPQEEDGYKALYHYVSVHYLYVIQAVFCGLQIGNIFEDCKTVSREWWSSASWGIHKQSIFTAGKFFL